MLPLLVRHLSKNLKLRSKELSPLGVQFLPKLGLILCRCPTCCAPRTFLAETLSSTVHQAELLRSTASESCEVPFWHANCEDSVPRPGMKRATEEDSPKCSFIEGPHASQRSWCWQLNQQWRAPKTTLSFTFKNSPYIQSISNSNLCLVIL